MKFWGFIFVLFRNNWDLRHAMEWDVNKMHTN